jgi:hypothetical protein
VPIYNIIKLIQPGTVSVAHRDFARFTVHRQAPGRRRGCGDKFGVRYTFNCVLWFNKFELRLAASPSCFSSRILCLTKYVSCDGRSGSGTDSGPILEHRRSPFSSRLPRPKLLEFRYANPRTAHLR